MSDDEGRGRGGDCSMAAFEVLVGKASVAD